MSTSSASAASARFAEMSCLALLAASLMLLSAKLRCKPSRFRLFAAASSIPLAYSPFVKSSVYRSATLRKLGLSESATVFLADESKRFGYPAKIHSAAVFGRFVGIVEVRPPVQQFPCYPLLFFDRMCF